MIFRLTQRLSAKIKADPLVSSPLDHNVYADWSARLFTAGRAQYILLSHTSSLYSVVMYGRGITYDGLFIGCAVDAIREFMAYDGLSLFYVNFIAPATSSVRFCKPLDRSVTGSMNELEALARLQLADGDIAPFNVGFTLNKTLLSAIGRRKTKDYSTPRDAFKRLGA